MHIHCPTPVEDGVSSCVPLSTTRRLALSESGTRKPTPRKRFLIARTNLQKHVVFTASGGKRMAVKLSSCTPKSHALSLKNCSDGPHDKKNPRLAAGVPVGP